MVIPNKNAFLIELSESTLTGFGKVDFDAQSPIQKIFSTIWTLESEVNSGGFAQYFCNSSETANSLLGALLEIGAPKTAAICEEAILLLFPNGLPKSAEEVHSVASQIDQKTISKIEKLNIEFYKYPNDLTDLLYDFVMVHREEFSVL
jgi:Domain of unknown function (DUF4375)